MFNEFKANPLSYLSEKLSNLSNTAPYVIKYSLFTVSAIFTILLFRSQGHSDFAKLLQSVLGFILELAKYTLPVVTIAGFILGKNINWGLRIAAGVLGLACFYYSIVATQGFQLLELQQINQQTYYNSDEYKSKQDQVERIKAQITTKQDQLKVAVETQKTAVDADKTSSTENTTLIKQYNADIKAWQKQIDGKSWELQDCINKEAKGKSQTNTKARLNTEIAQLKKNIDNATASRNKLTNSNATGSTSTLVSKLNDDISKLNNDLDNVQNGKSDINIPKNGYEVLFDAETLARFIFWLSVLIELIGIYFAIIIGFREKKATYSPPQAKLPEMPEPPKSWSSQHTPQPHFKTSKEKMEGFEEEAKEAKKVDGGLVLDTNSRLNKIKNPKFMGFGHPVRFVKVDGKTYVVSAEETTVHSDSDADVEITDDYITYSNDAKKDKKVQFKKVKNVDSGLVLDTNQASDAENAEELIDDTNIKKSDIKKYMKYMYENSENNISVGVIKLARNIEMAQGKAKAIKGHLENLDILDVIEGDTHILKTEAEAKKILKIKY